MIPASEEEKLIFDKRYTCPCCDHEFKAKHVKTNGTKMDHTEFDLRPVYKGLDATKYDVILCNECGYAALERYFPDIVPVQRKKVREQVTTKFRPREKQEGVYSYAYAVERYKLALYCTIQKGTRSSEIGYVCLKMAWVLQNMADDMEQNMDQYTGASAGKVAQLRAQADTYEIKAYDAMYKARMEENSPICGMDEVTFDYLVAALAYKADKLDVASRMLSNVSTSKNATDRLKDKAYDLKQMISQRMKEKGEEE